MVRHSILFCCIIKVLPPCCHSCCAVLKSEHILETCTACRYVICESLAVRKAIIERFGTGRTIVTDTTTVMHHTDCHHFPTEACAGAQALLTAVGELWVFSATDVQVRYTQLKCRVYS